MIGRIYRNVDVYISGASHTPPSPNEMYRQVKAFYMDLQDRAIENVIELAASLTRKTSSNNGGLSS
ncbi:hypothetical protein ACOAOT_05350 [Lacrimispora sp. AGF001]|uniref:hypothetical protein n=1 Tax=Lacrimispora sp. AGF001 TaxID=3401631 RepID=UPI003B434615